MAGEILGEKVLPLGAMDYRYPIISGQQIHLWEEYYYCPYPYYYSPWWGFDPWWGYPYGWGELGFNYFGGYNCGDHDGHHDGGHHK